MFENPLSRVVEKYTSRCVRLCIILLFQQTHFNRAHIYSQCLTMITILCVFNHILFPSLTRLSDFLLKSTCIQFTFDNEYPEQTGAMWYFPLRLFHFANVFFFFIHFCLFGCISKALPLQKSCGKYILLTKHLKSYLGSFPHYELLTFDMCLFSLSYS